MEGGGGGCDEPETLFLVGWFPLQVWIIGYIGISGNGGVTFIAAVCCTALTVNPCICLFYFT